MTALKGNIGNCHSEKTNVDQGKAEVDSWFSWWFSWWYWFLWNVSQPIRIIFFTCTWKYNIIKCLPYAQMKRNKMNRCMICHGLGFKNTMFLQRIFFYPQALTIFFYHILKSLWCFTFAFLFETFLLTF